MKYLMLAVGLFLATSAQAKQYKEVTEYVQKEVRTIGGAIDSATMAEPMDFGGKFEFKNFWLRIQAKIGFDVPGVNVTLVPELELAFQKDPVQDHT